MGILDVFYAVMTGCVLVISVTIFELVSVHTAVARIKLARKERQDKARRLAEKSAQRNHVIER